MLKRIDDFISEAGVFFLATADDKQAKLRPLGAHILKDGKLYFFVGDFKDVYKQMEADPFVEIVAYKAEDKTWLRYTGKAVFEEDDMLAKQVIEERPPLKKTYNDETGYKLMLFHLEDASAAIYKVGTVIETL